MALTKEQAEKIQGRGRIDSTVCHWTENPRFWGPTPEDAAALLIEHLNHEHAPAWTQEALF